VLAARVTRTAGWELVNVVWLPVVVFGLLDAPFTLPNLVGYGLTAVLLLEGAAYWLRKARQLRGARARTGWSAFRTLKRLNVVLLAAGLAVVVGGVLLLPAAEAVPGLVFAALAVAEHVNYFHRQLMYDTAADLRWLVRHRRLRRSHLAVDLGHDRRRRAQVG
jgi:hypothetical protein